MHAEWYLSAVNNLCYTLFSSNGQKYFCPELVAAIEEYVMSCRVTNGRASHVERRVHRDFGVYRPAIDSPVADRVVYGSNLLYALVLFYDAVNARRNICYFDNCHDGKNLVQK